MDEELEEVYEDTEADQKEVTEKAQDTTEIAR